MLVLSREAGEAVVIDEAVVFTVAVMGSDFVDMHRSNVDGRERSIMTLITGKQLHIMKDVTAVLIHQRGNRVRLGFEYPRDEISIRRQEIPPGI